MKRILHVFLCVVICSYSYGQQVQVGLFAGTQATWTKYLIKNQHQPADAKLGFNAGAVVKVPFEGHLFFSPSLYYTMKGYKVKLNDSSFPPSTLAIDNNTTVHSVEGACLLQYDFSLSPSHLFIKAGPSLDLVVAGREKFNLMDGTFIKQKMKLDFENYGRYGGSVVLQLGYEAADGYMFFVQYTKSLGSMNNADGGPKILNRVISISVGKFLHSDKIVIDTRNKE